MLCPALSVFRETSMATLRTPWKTHIQDVRAASSLDFWIKAWRRASLDINSQPEPLMRNRSTFHSVNDWISETYFLNLSLPTINNILVLRSMIYLPTTNTVHDCVFKIYMYILELWYFYKSFPRTYKDTHIHTHTQPYTHTLVGRI